MVNKNTHTHIIARLVVTSVFCWVTKRACAEVDFIPGMSRLSRMQDGKTERNANYQVYTNSTKAPRVSTKKPRTLSAVQGSRPQMCVSCEYTQIMGKSQKSTDSYFGSERKNTVRKFPRLTLTSIKRAYDGLAINVSYTFREGNSDSTVTEDVQVDGGPAGRNIIIDFAGINDATGGAVDSTSLSSYTTLHAKIKYYAADLVAVAVKVTDTQGAVLYDGTWRDSANISSGGRRRTRD